MTEDGMRKFDARFFEVSDWSAGVAPAKHAKSTKGRLENTTGSDSWSMFNG